MRYAWLVIAIFFARFVTDAVAFPPSDGDLAWQAWLGRAILARHAIPRALGGETFTAPGAGWTPQEWAFSLGVALAKHSDAAWILFATLVALGCVLALVLVARTSALLGAAPVWVAVATALAGVLIFQSFGVRAQVAAWPLVAALLLLVQLRDRRVWWIVALTALWSNVHASVLLAPVVTALVAAGTWLDEERRIVPEVRRLALVATASLAATCLNPFGPALPLYAVHLFNDTTLRSLINEWHPTKIGDFSFAIGALPLLVASAIVGLGTRTPWRHVIVLWAFAFLVLDAARNIGIFGIVAAPYVAAAITARVRAAHPASDAARPSAREARIAAIALPAVSLALAAGVVAGLLGNREARRPDAGIASAVRAIASSRDRRVLCEDFSNCSFFLSSGVRDFLDGRADPFPDDVWSDYGKIVRLAPGWREALQARGVDALLVKRDGALDRAAALTGGWRSVYHDARYDALVR